MNLNLPKDPRTNWNFILIVVILGFLAGGGILAWQYLRVRADETANWKSYRNEKYGYEIKYPKGWTIQETTRESTNGPYRRYYGLNIFHPEKITLGKPYGNVSVEFFGDGDIDKVFETMLSLMRRDLTLTIEEVTIGNIKGFKGTAYYEEIDQTKTMFITQIFLNKEKLGIYRIEAVASDLDKEIYQEKTKLILSTFRFLE